MSKILDTDITKQLLERFEKYGIDFEKNEDYFFSKGMYPGITAQAFEMERYEDSVVVQVDIHILLPERDIVESFVGHSDTIENAMDEAMQQFDVSVLHLMIAAFWAHGEKIENGIGYEQWEINGHRYQAVVGNYGYRGHRTIDEILPENLFETIQEEISCKPLDKDIYAFRTVYTNVGDGRKVAEAFLNNQSFDELENAVSKLPWPELEEFYAVRNLIFLMKLSEN